MPGAALFFAARSFDFTVYFSKALVGYFSLSLLFVIFLSVKLHRYLGLGLFVVYLFISLSVQLDRSYQKDGYEELADYARYSDRIMVFTNPFDYTITKYYLSENVWQNIRLQDNSADLSEWVLIASDEIFVKDKAQEPFYLVNHGSLKGWDSNRIVEEFYLYKWTN